MVSGDPPVSLGPAGCCVLRTFYLVVGSLFPVADVDKVETRFGLRKAQRKVFQVALVGQAAVAAHGLAETGQVGVHLGNNFNLAGVGAALLENGSPQGVCRLFAAIDTLAGKGFLELERKYVSETQETSEAGSLTKRQSPSMRTIT